MLKSIKMITLFCLAVLSANAIGSTVYWSGPGGDMWNTNSSPYDVDPVRPFDVFWASYSTDGQFNRASGIALADVGATSTPYLFGSAGWSENRPYRKSRTNGASTGWVAENAQNDSGTGFRIALSPDGSRLYHIDIGNQIRAYDTTTNPAGTPLWSIDGDAGSRGIKNLVKVGPDGLIYGHFAGATALDPADGSVEWQSTGNPENANMPGAFYSDGITTWYIVSGSTTKICAYNITSLNPDPVWTYTDSQNGYSGPTIDPNTGDIYVFRTTRLIKLTSSGSFVWASPAISSGESCYSYGALSRDGQTFYYQTGNTSSTGKLYAFNTSDGSVKWIYATNARASMYYGGPVVSNNGLVFVANAANSPSDNLVYCIQDGGQGNPILLDTFDMYDQSDAGGPTLAIGPGGVVYMDGWSASNSILLFAFKTMPVYSAPANVQVTPYYSTAHITWDPTAGDNVKGYAVFRRTSIGSYPSEPTKYVGPRTQFTDYNLTPGQLYYYKIASHDALGNINSPFTEVTAGMYGNPDDYSVHANLELLMVVYTEGWTTLQVEQYVNGLKKGLDFYWRNSKMRMNLDVTWFLIDAPIPATDGSYGPIVSDLRTRGIRDDQYDLLYTIGKGLGPCLGGYTIFNSTKASLGIVCGVAYPGKDPNVNYTIPWTFTHEIHHAIDGMVDLAGADDMLFCHFPWNYPSPLDGTWHVDWGTHYDGIAKTMRLYDDYMNFGSYYDGYIECVDQDGDYMPDNDTRVFMDEARFGSSGFLADTDDDGLSDAEEYYRYNFTGTDPNDQDTDDDGELDGADHEPLYKVPSLIAYTAVPPTLNGTIEPSWSTIAEDYYFTKNTTDFDLTMYGNYDVNYLYFAFKSSQQLRFKISLDGSGADGRFESDVRHVDGTTEPFTDEYKAQYYGDSWGDGNHLYTYYGASAVEVYGVGTISGSQVSSSTSGGFYYTEIKIPRTMPHGCAYTWYPVSAPVVDGLRLNEGQIIGLGITVSNYSGSSGSEFSGTWTGVFETHSYVDYTLSGTGDIDGDGLDALAEGANGTDPLDADTDDDGMTDGWEVTYGLNPLLNDAGGNPDSDGLTNLEEHQYNTNPNNDDSDDDGLKDGDEVFIYHTDPANADTDGDGRDDGQEIAEGTDPLVPDARTYYVSATTGNDSYDGVAESWDGVHGPKKTIQAGIDVSHNTDEVIVLSGTYTGIGNRNINFNGKAIIVKSRDGAENVTVDCEDQGRGFIFNSGETSTSVLDGFTITNGYVEIEDGGGIYCENSSPIIRNCALIGNNAPGGGGFECYNSNGIQILNCLVAGNTATYFGAGLVIAESTATISNCTLVNNDVDALGFYGGAIYNYESNTNLINCIVWDNLPDEIYVEGSLSLTASYSDIKGGWAGTGNINIDPEFVPGTYHDYYLSHSILQGSQSPCVDAGSDTSSNLGLANMSTRTDAVPDTGVVDMGYHALYSLKIHSISRIGSDITIYWDAAEGVSYIIEWSDDMLLWTPVSVGQTDNWTDIGGGLVSEMYYRIREE